MKLLKIEPKQKRYIPRTWRPKDEHKVWAYAKSLKQQLQPSATDYSRVVESWKKHPNFIISTGQDTITYHHSYVKNFTSINRSHAWRRLNLQNSLQACQNIAKVRLSFQPDMSQMPSLGSVKHDRDAVVYGKRVLKMSLKKFLKYSQEALIFTQIVHGIEHLNNNKHSHGDSRWMPILEDCTRIKSVPLSTWVKADLQHIVNDHQAHKKRSAQLRLQTILLLNFKASKFHNKLWT